MNRAPKPMDSREKLMSGDSCRVDTKEGIIAKAVSRRTARTMASPRLNQRL